MPSQLLKRHENPENTVDPGKPGIESLVAEYVVSESGELVLVGHWDLNQFGNAEKSIAGNE